MNVLKRDINKLDKLIAKDKLVVEQNAHSSRAIIKLINGYF
ncbi:hypothetical protein FACS189459_2500 [Bacilli bacterium]|nr:hypothetical protein FACS189459_2500 [Bacilli bacterium]